MCYCEPSFISVCGSQANKDDLNIIISWCCIDASLQGDFYLFLYHKPVLHIDRHSIQDDWLCLEIMKEIWDTVYYFFKPQHMSLFHELTTV